MREKAVITGVGAVSCVGHDATSFWHALKTGQSGIQPIEGMAVENLSTRIAGEVRGFKPQGKQFRRMARYTQFAFQAAQEALAQARLVREEDYVADPTKTGVLVGTGVGGFTFLMAQHQKFLEQGPGKFHPLTVPIIINNMASAHIAMHYGLKGPNLSISSACATGNHALGYGLDLIRHGRAEVMVVGGSEASITPFSIDGYAQLRALSQRNETPQTASRPFSISRDGFVLAEGAGIVVLESETHALKRGAPILAELAGFGMSSDAYHLTAPDPEGKGVILAMQHALADAELSPERIEYINAHGTSTPLNDALETQAIKAVFGAHANELCISSIKSMIGHSLGAAAALEAVACVQALQEGVIPPTINLKEPDPALELDYVPLEARSVPLERIMSNAFAFGGQNAVSIFSRYR